MSYFHFTTAPEVFAVAMDECQGYSFGVDWWSLGICAYEMLRGKVTRSSHSVICISDDNFLMIVHMDIFAEKIRHVS